MCKLAAAIACAVLIGTGARAAPIVYAAEDHDPASIQASVQAFRQAAGSDRDRGAVARSLPRTAAGEHDRPSAGAREPRAMHAPAVQAPEPADRGLFAPLSASRLFAPLDKSVAGAFVTVPGTTTVLAAIARLRPLLPDMELLSAHTLQLLDDALEEPLGGRPARRFDAKLVGVAFEPDEVRPHPNSRRFSRTYKGF